MTTPSTSQLTYSPSLTSPPRIEPAKIEEFPKSVEVLIPPHPRDAYITKLCDKRLMDPKGNWLASKISPDLDPEDQQEILKSWQILQKVENPDFNFTWSLHQFLKYFVLYFTKTFESTTVELIQGVHHTLGKGFWEKRLQRFGIETPSEKMWDFCTTPPHSYRFLVRIPAKCLAQDIEATFEQFYQFSIYLLVVQKQPQTNRSLFEILNEYRNLMNLPKEGEPPHLEELRGVMRTLKGKGQVFSYPGQQTSSIEIPLTPDSSLSFIFSYSPANQVDFFYDSLRLKIRSNAETLFCEMDKPIQALIDPLIHRFSPPFLLGKYWAAMTWNGGFLNEQEIEKQLIKNQGDLNLAFSDGKTYLPLGSEAMIAYLYNASYFLERHHLSHSFGENLAAQTPFGLFLISAPINQIGALLQIGAALQPSLEEISIYQKKDQLHICYKAPFPLHFMIPYHLQEAIAAIHLWLKNDRPACLKSFSQMLEIFFPLLDKIQEIESSHLRPIYKALQNEEEFTEAALRILCLLKDPIEETDLLKFPCWLAYGAKIGKLGLFLKILAKKMEKSPFLPLFSAIEKNLASLENPTPDAVRSAALKPLLTSCEIKILSLAWTQNTVDAQSLLEMVEELDSTALPFALNQLLRLSPTQERDSLLLAYLNRISSFSTPQINSYRPLLIKADPTLLDHLTYPSNFPSGRVIDQLIEDLPLFAKHGNLRIISIIEALTPSLHQTPPADPLWSKYFYLLASLAKEDLFLETFVRLFESLAKLHPSPLQNFKKKIPKLEKRFSPDQQKRLSTVFAEQILKAPKTKEDPPILESVPSMTWLMEQLGLAGDWDRQAKLFLLLYPRKKVALEHALEAALHVTSSEIMIPLSQLILKQTSRDLASPEWKFAIARWIAMTSHLTKELFGLLSQLINKAERRFYDECWNLYLKNDLSFKEMLADYHQNKALPLLITSTERELARLRTQIRESIGKENFKEAVELLDIISTAEHELWTLYFQTLINSYKVKPIKETWAIWLKKHPISSVKPEDGQLWTSAIAACLTGFKTMKSAISSFLTNHLYQLLEQVEAADCKWIARECIQIACTICWKENNEESQLILKQIHRLLLDAKLKTKIGEPWLLLDLTHETCLALELAHHPDPALVLTGQLQFFLLTISATSAGDYSTDDNKTIFHYYCSNPYVPSEIHDQLVIYEWADKSWDGLKLTLDWDQTCSFLSALLTFKYIKTAESVLDKWTEAEATLKNGSAILPVQLLDFRNVTIDLMDRLCVDRLESEKLFSSLAILHEKFHQFNMQCSPKDLACFENFQLNYIYKFCKLCRKYFPQDLHPLKLTLESLKSCPLVNDVTTEGIFPLFIEILHKTLPASAQYPDLMDLHQTVICRLLDNSYTIQAELLIALCSTLQETVPEKRRILERFVLNIFIDCTDPTRLQSRKYKDLLRPVAISALGYGFLTMRLETLTLSDFETLIQGLSLNTVQEMLQMIFKEIPKKNTPTLYLYHLSATRLIRYSKNVDGLLPYCLEKLPPFDTKASIPLQLTLLTGKILALCSYMKNFPQTSNDLNNLKTKLTEELIEHILPLMIDDDSYKTFSPFILQLLQDDPDIGQALKRAFQIPPHLPPALASKLLLLQSLIFKKFPD